jgi:hypothetical protein
MADLESALIVSAAWTGTRLISRQVMTTRRNRFEVVCGFSIGNPPVDDMPDDVGSAETE